LKAITSTGEGMGKVKLREKDVTETSTDFYTHTFDVNKIRQGFPILKQKVHGKPLIYLDNAATSQKPQQVIDALINYYKNYNANIHRGVHRLSEIATEEHEAVRARVANFISAKSPKEIIFTRNTTEAINIVAYSFGTALKKGDNIISTVMEHHSNIVPWQMLKKRGVELRFVDIDDEGKLRTEEYDELIDENTKIVAVTQASNVLGTINDIRKIVKIAHDAGALIVVDGAQSTPHMPVDVQKLDCDFFAFSGHKMLGPTGIGVLYGKRQLLEQMQPFLRGGDMIKEVHLEETTFNDLPYKFEAGTPNVADTIAFGAAIDYLQDLGMTSVRRHEIQLTRYALDVLNEIKGMKIYGPQDPKEKAGVISFNLADIHSHDVATIVDEEGIAIRSGHNCAMPLMKRLGCESVARASFYIYNTEDEIDKLKSALEKVKKVFKI